MQYSPFCPPTPPPPPHTHTHSADKFHIEDGTIGGVSATCTPVNERGARANDRGGQGDSIASRAAEPSDVFYRGDAVVLATGHSARDVYYELHNAGVKLEAKGFAVGFRVEHPQVRSKIRSHARFCCPPPPPGGAQKPIHLFLLLQKPFSA
jgi:hypothetical protein